MLIEPNSEVRFLAVPWDATYENTMFFANASEQYSYMSDRIFLTIQNNSYMRKGRGWIRVGWGTDTAGIPSQNAISRLYRAAYMMFRNTSYENKWWYAFINRVEYVNDNTVDVFYSIDVIQSYLFELGFNQCFIERQHTVTDTFGANTIPEDFEIGDYVSSDKAYDNYTPCILVVCASEPDGEYTPGTLIPGPQSYFSGVKIHKFALEEVDALNTYLEQFASRGRQDAILSILMAPAYWANAVLGEEVSPAVFNFSVVHEGKYCLGHGTGEGEGYTPRNKKLLTYPFNMLYCTNMQGVGCTWKFEYFTDPLHITAKVWGNCSSNPAVITWPCNYKGQDDNHEEGTQLSGFPFCAWTYDTFKAWLAQNGGMIAAAGLGVISEMYDTHRSQRWEPDTVSDYIFNSLIGKALPGKTVPQLPGQTPLQLPGQTGYTTDVSTPHISNRGLMGAVALLATVRDHYIKPPTAQGYNTGSLLYQAGLMHFVYEKKHIKREYAEIIDQFFDMYGYAIHKVGIPNLNARPCYTYVKTQGCSITGDIPADDARAIESIFDSGIRFWKTTAQFGNYNNWVNPNTPEVVG